MSSSTDGLYDLPRCNLRPLKLKGPAAGGVGLFLSRSSRRRGRLLRDKKKEEKEEEREEEKKKKKKKKTTSDFSSLAAEVISGTGRIVSSTTTIQGFETQFLDEVKPGDEMVLQHPTSLQVENRTVMGILSNRSLTMDLPFSTDLVSTTTFHIRKVSTILESQIEKQLLLQRKNNTTTSSQEKEKEKDEEEEKDNSTTMKKLVQDQISLRLQNTLNKNKRFVAVRQKTGMWGYRTVNKSLNPGDDTTAEGMLNERCKQGRDKYCF